MEEGTLAIEAYGEVIRRTVKLRGPAGVPQLTLVCGLCVGAAAYCAALTDVVGMVRGQSYLFITGPRVTSDGRDVDLEGRWWRRCASRRRLACHAAFDNEREGIAWLQRMCGYLQTVAAAGDPIDRPTPELGTIIPTAERRGYDMRKVVDHLCDEGSTEELSAFACAQPLTVPGAAGGRTIAGGVAAASAGRLTSMCLAQGAAFA